jgi:hypothetical protein
VSTYGDVATALASKLSPLATTYKHPLSNPAAPCFIVMPQPTDYDLTSRSGAHRQAWTVRYLCGAADVRTGFETKLYTVMAHTGTGSVKAALEADKTLGGVVDTLRVVRHEEPGIYEYGGVELLGVDFVVDVIP